MKRRYRIYVSTTTTQRYEIIAHDDDEVYDLWECDPTMFLVIGQPAITETLNIGQSVPFEEGPR